MKIVLDTNVLIDADRDELSYANRIIEAVLEGRLVAYANEGTLRENRLILHREIKNPEWQEKIEDFFSQVKPVNFIDLDAVVDDEEDNKILASAVAAEADFLITADWDLLSLEEYEDIKIVDPGSFWHHYRREVLGEDDWKNFIDQYLK